MLEVLPLTHIRGRSLHDAFVIVDEAQSLERNVLLTVLSPHRPELAGRAHPRRRPARQPAGRPPRRRRLGDRDAQGPPAVRAHHAHPLGALRDRRPRHRDAGVERARLSWSAAPCRVGAASRRSREGLGVIRAALLRRLERAVSCRRARVELTARARRCSCARRWVRRARSLLTGVRAAADRSRIAAPIRCGAGSSSAIARARRSARRSAEPVTVPLDGRTSSVAPARRAVATALVAGSRASSRPGATLRCAPA